MGLIIGNEKIRLITGDSFWAAGMKIWPHRNSWKITFGELTYNVYAQIRKIVTFVTCLENIKMCNENCTLKY